MFTSEEARQKHLAGCRWQEGFTCWKAAPDQPEVPFKEDVVAYRALGLIASDGAG